MAIVTVLFLCMAYVVPASALGSWDLAINWSDTENPGPVWAYGYINLAGVWNDLAIHS